MLSTDWFSALLSCSILWFNESYVSINERTIYKTVKPKKNVFNGNFNMASVIIEKIYIE